MAEIRTGMTARAAGNSWPEWGEGWWSAATSGPDKTKSTRQVAQPCRALRNSLKTKGGKDTAVREMPC